MPLNRHHPPSSRLTPPPDLVFGIWLAVASASVILLALTLRSGALAFVLHSDSTGISAVILVLFMAVSLWAGRRAWVLSREALALSQAVDTPPRLPEDPHPPSHCVKILQALRRKDAPREDLRLLLTEHLHGPHAFGWFLTDTVTRLGLLGTVLGFLIMLTALVGANQLELSAMQAILRDMAGGMGIKIIATVTGLIANMLLALQFLLLDRAADRLVAGVLEASLFEHRA